MIGAVSLVLLCHRINCKAARYAGRFTNGGGWGISNNKLLFKNDRLLFSPLLSGNFCGGTRL